MSKTSAAGGSGPPPGARLYSPAGCGQAGPMRPDGRLPDQLRAIPIVPNYLRSPEGSAHIRAGDTWVVCTASVEERVPMWLKEQGTGGGWVTAEYGMLPRATGSRTSRA